MLDEEVFSEEISSTENNKCGWASFIEKETMFSLSAGEQALAKVHQGQTQWGCIVTAELQGKRYIYSSIRLGYISFHSHSCLKLIWKGNLTLVPAFIGMIC